MGDKVGFLKECNSFAYYNLKGGVTLALSERKRAGIRFRADHTVMPKCARTEPQPGEAAPSPADALQKLVNSAPKLPALPALPKLPGLPSPGTLPGLPPPGTAPGLGMNLFPGASTGTSGLAPGLGSTGPGGGGLALPGGLQLPGAG